MNKIIAIKQDVLPNYSSISDAMEFKVANRDEMVYPSHVTSQRILQRRKYEEYSYTTGSSEEE